MRQTVLVLPLLQCEYCPILHIKKLRYRERKNNLPKVTELLNGSTGICPGESGHLFTAVNSNFLAATRMTQKGTRRRGRTAGL